VLSVYSRLEQLFDSKRMYLLVAALIGGMALIGLAFANRPLAAIILILVAGGFGLTRADIFSNHLQKQLPSSQRATVLSTVSMYQRLGLTILNPFLGLGVEKSLETTLVVVGGGIVVLALLSRVREEHLIS